MNFKPIGNGSSVEGFCLIKSVDIKTSNKGDTYLDLTLSDSSGEINGKLWNYDENIAGTYSANDIVKVRGTITLYKNNEQLRIDMIRPAKDDDGVDPADFVKSASYPTETMFNELHDLASAFDDEELSKLTLYLLDKNKEKLLFWPAAYKLHHAMRGGLLFHTLSIVRMCYAASEIYAFVNRDLLVSGAILHDIAKTVEYDVATSGISNGYTDKGNLIGHLAGGAMMVNEAAKELGISEDTAMLVQHMILSHHGEPEFGACVRPAFIEAELLSEFDLMDARIYEMQEVLSGVEKGKFSGNIWSMDNRKLYNHGKNDFNKKTELF